MGNETEERVFFFPPDIRFNTIKAHLQLISWMKFQWANEWLPPASLVLSGTPVPPAEHHSTSPPREVGLEWGETAWRDSSTAVSFSFCHEPDNVRQKSLNSNSRQTWCGGEKTTRQQRCKMKLVCVYVFLKRHTSIWSHLPFLGYICTHVHLIW